MRCRGLWGRRTKTSKGGNRAGERVMRPHWVSRLIGHDHARPDTHLAPQLDQSAVVPKPVGLPAEVRNALAHMCRGARAQHQFAGYSQNSRTLVLHFEHLHCGDRAAFCTQAGCLHQVYISTSTGGRYRLLRSYYAPEGDNCVTSNAFILEKRSDRWLIVSASAWRVPQ